MVLQTNHKNVPIPEELHKKLKIVCAERGITIKDVLVQLISGYLKENAKELKRGKK